MRSNRMTVLAVGGAFALGAFGANALADDGETWDELRDYANKLTIYRVPGDKGSGIVRLGFGQPGELRGAGPPAFLEAHRLVGLARLLGRGRGLARRDRRGGRPRAGAPRARAAARPSRAR